MFAKLKPSLATAIEGMYVRASLAPLMTRHLLGLASVFLAHIRNPLYIHKTVSIYCM